MHYQTIHTLYNKQAAHLLLQNLVGEAKSSGYHAKARTQRLFKRTESTDPIWHFRITIYCDTTAGKATTARRIPIALQS